LFLKPRYIKSALVDFCAYAWMRIPALMKRSTTMHCLHTYL